MGLIVVKSMLNVLGDIWRDFNTYLFYLQYSNGLV
jgi:hypothetical protein